MPRTPAKYNSGNSYEQGRQSSHARGYNKRWAKARLGYLAKHPVCVECERQGIVTAATEVDHIVPHRGDWYLFWDSANWQALCKSCHSKKTAGGR
jgi:5-methylcytosine-specific restriction protein A